MSDIEVLKKIECKNILFSLRKKIKLIKNENSGTLIDKINGLLKDHNMFLSVTAEKCYYLAVIGLKGYYHSVTFCREFIPPAVNECKGKDLDKCVSILETAKKNAILGIFSTGVG